ncbi:hypothetical protein pah_c008o028 [Parachlamydia acanthamoebae str. Hall's coccus]|nr:hypothetical protein pah_c008o028 [Parachlamydia acanthamoebae str. Hall's coccus]
MEFVSPSGARGKKLVKNFNKQEKCKIFINEFKARLKTI